MPEPFDTSTPNPTSTVKSTLQRVVRGITFSAGSGDEAWAAYDEWRADREEETFMDWSYIVDGEQHHVVILFTE